MSAIGVQDRGESEIETRACVDFCLPRHLLLSRGHLQPIFWSARPSPRLEYCCTLGSCLRLFCSLLSESSAWSIFEDHTTRMSARLALSLSLLFVVFRSFRFVIIIIITMTAIDAVAAATTRTNRFLHEARVTTTVSCCCCCCCHCSSHRRSCCCCCRLSAEIHRHRCSMTYQIQARRHRRCLPERCCC